MSLAWGQCTSHVIGWLGILHHKIDLFGDVLSFRHSLFWSVVFGVIAQISLFTLKSVPVSGDHFYVCLELFKAEGWRGGTQPHVTSLKGGSNAP